MKSGRLITIGSFDGVHRGHQALLQRVQIEAKKRNLKSLAITFEIPPRMVLYKNNPVLLLSDSFEKEWLIRRHGVDEVNILNFGKRMAGLRPFHFFRDELVRRFKAKGIVVGSDFRFGSGRSAGVVEMVRWGLEFGIPVWVIPPVKWQKRVVSSSYIRSLLEVGRYKRAVGFLGHPYSVFGKVEKGRGLGEKLGYPTANLRTIQKKTLPKGVFVVKGGVIRHPRDVRKKLVINNLYGVCNIGFRPTFLKNKKLSVEVHFFNHGGDLKGKRVFLELLSRLRSEKKFSNARKLIQAINKDVESARRFLKLGKS